MSETIASRQGQVDALVAEARAFFAKVPEPPVYARRDDPIRAQALTLAAQGQRLAERATLLGVSALAGAIEQHVLALQAVAAGRSGEAERLWAGAVTLERASTASLRLWSRTDEAPLPAVYDSQTRTSRFDPRPEARMEVKLVCPGCRKVSAFSLSPLVASHTLTCALCSVSFMAYVAEVTALELSGAPGRWHYHLRLQELSGRHARVEFDDVAPQTLEVSKRDLLAFLYGPNRGLKGVLNLNSSRVLWLASSACFVATVAFGEGADQLEVLRRFRDQVLLRSAAGRLFVAWYYRRGPALALVVSARPWLRRGVRQVLGRVVATLEWWQ